MKIIILTLVLLTNNLFADGIIDPMSGLIKAEELPKNILTSNDNDESLPKINIHAVDTYLPALLQMLAEQSGYNIVTGPNVNEKDKLTIHIEDVPIDQAINMVVRASGLSYEILGNSILVASQEKLTEDVGITPQVITLQYANAEDVSSLLMNITDQITVDRAGNKLLINASPKKIAEIQSIIEKIDVPALQIMLEAKLIEVTLSEEDKNGIDWAKLSQFQLILAESGMPLDLGNGATTGSLLPGSSFEMDDQGNVLETLEGQTLGQLPESMTFQRLSGENDFGLSRQLTAFDITLDLLLKNNKASVLANSQVVTLNGHSATIRMVDIVPYILSSGGVGGQVQVQRTEVGVKLDITPTVNTDGFITTTVTPEVSSIYDFIGPDRNIPWEKKRVTTTTVRSQDGESIIIGGLLNGSKINVQSKVPLLWRIPWGIGQRFFTHTSQITSTTDLIIQITPKIVKDNYTKIKKSEIHLETEQIFEDFGNFNQEDSEEKNDDK